MKIVRRTKNKIFFEVSQKEKNLLLAILKLFPLVPKSHHRLSKYGEIPGHEENQRLLEESLQHQQNENRQLLAALLGDAGRFKPCEAGFKFSLARTEIEWLLQVLNDVRIGSWIALGSPDLEQDGQLAVNFKTLPHLQRMELAGMFEMFFLKAISGPA
jgi:hypothetical protein